MPTNEPTRATASINGIDYTYLEQGSGPLALCLHGFPDTATGWVPLLADLANAGFHAVAPFMRGYAPTAVPEDGRSPLGGWVADTLALRDLLGGDDQSVIIGHDWGALATYGAASHAPDAWRRVVTASIPPSSVMGARLLDYDQLKMFWYQYVFLQPTAETIVANDDFEFISQLWGDWSPGFDASAVLPGVKDAIREPAHLTAALSTYRCVYDFDLAGPEFADFALAPFMAHNQPTLYLHGEHDGCVDASVVAPTRDALPDGSRVELVAGAGHFLQYEQPAVVNRLIVDFVTS